MFVGFSASRLTHPARRTEVRAIRRRAPLRRIPTPPGRRRSVPPEAPSRPCAPTGGISTAPCRSTVPRHPSAPRPRGACRLPRPGSMLPSATTALGAPVRCAPALTWRPPPAPRPSRRARAPHLRERPAAGADALALYDDNGNGKITCAEARRHGIAPVARNHPAYRYMRDGDRDGVGCE